MPFSEELHSLSIILLTSSFVVSFFTSAIRPTIEPVIAPGTRIETASILPFSSGITFATALAAPVEVGIMLLISERALRMSL